MFKVGDEVYSQIFGFGTVRKDKVDPNRDYWYEYEYPILVRFQCPLNHQRFTIEGRFHNLQPNNYTDIILTKDLKKVITDD